MDSRDIEFDEWFNSSSGEEVELGLKALLGREVAPALALYDLDREAYMGSRAEWLDDRLKEALEDGLPKDVAERNRRRFADLSSCAIQGSVVPFVGAGLSHPYGMPLWSDFLRKLSQEARCVRDTTREMKSGDYETAASRLVKKLGESGFQERYRSSFRLQPKTKPTPAVRALTAFANGAFVTTNFDSVLESAAGASRTFVGRESLDFCRHVASGRRAVLKVHGEIEKADSRVLTQVEYDAAYGKKGKLNRDLAIPRALDALFRTSTFLFVGCSLGADRMLSLLEDICARGPAQYLPEHYALLEYRTGKHGEGFLNRRQIFPIWYPKGKHEVVEVLLRHLEREAP